MDRLRTIPNPKRMSIEKHLTTSSSYQQTPFTLLEVGVWTNQLRPQGSESSGGIDLLSTTTTTSSQDNWVDQPLFDLDILSAISQDLSAHPNSAPSTQHPQTAQSYSSTSRDFDDLLSYSHRPSKGNDDVFNYSNTSHEITPTPTTTPQDPRMLPPNPDVRGFPMLERWIVELADEAPRSMLQYSTTIHIIPSSDYDMEMALSDTGAIWEIPLDVHADIGQETDSSWVQEMMRGAPS